jgi:hypothetical protein
MRFQTPNGQVVHIDAPFSMQVTLLDDDGNAATSVQQFPAGWLRQFSAQERADRGFVELPEDPVEVIPPAPIVPTRVSQRQARIALLRGGLLDAVDLAVEEEGGEAKITWEWAEYINRHDPFIETLGSKLGLSDDDIDDLFIAAAGIV